MKEIWVKITGLSGAYEASNLGNIKNKSGKILCSGPALHGRGYRRVCLNQKTYLVHRLIALTFIPMRSKERDQVNHKDGDKLNNSVENLEWVTDLENRGHAKKSGLIKSKINKAQALEIRRLAGAGGLSQSEIAKCFGISQVNVSMIHRKKTWNYI